MQDLKFHGKHTSANAKTTFNVAVTYRTDLVSQDRIAENLTILEDAIYDVPADANLHEELFGDTFRTNKTLSLTDFKNFATTNGLLLTIKNSDGTNLETLVDATSSHSSSN